MDPRDADLGATAIHPPMADDYADQDFDAPQAPAEPLQARLGGAERSRPEPMTQSRPEPMTQELPPVIDEPPPPPPARPGQQSGTFRPRPGMRRGAPDSQLESTQAHPGPLESTQADAGPYLDDDDEFGAESFESDFAEGHDGQFSEDDFPGRGPGYPGERTQYARPPQQPDPRAQGTQLINPKSFATDDYPDQDFRGNGFPGNEFPPHGHTDEDIDSFGDEQYDRDRRNDPRDRDDRDRDDLDRDDDDREPADLDDVPQRSAGREWLVTGAQVGVGAIAGAAVWLGFSWLWGLLPIAAAIAAIVVVIGLILIVRRWRKAEDLQTTVLAILAGLVVTVSPAALLLVKR